MQIAGPFYPHFQFPGGYTANIPDVRVAPDLVRSLALNIIDRCAIQQRGTGGFGTLGLGNLANLVLSTGVTPWNTLPNHWPTSIGFITVQLSNHGTPNRYPGDTDPSVPIIIAGVVRFHPDALAHTIKRPLVATQWGTQAARMSRGGSIPWWSRPVPILRHRPNVLRVLRRPRQPRSNRLHTDRVGSTSSRDGSQNKYPNR